MKWSNIADRVITFISNVIFSLMFLVVLLQIIGRYVMQNPFMWTEELARVLYVWLIFFGSSTLIKGYEHITIDFVQRRLSPQKEKIFKVIIDVLAFVFFIFVILGGLKMMKNSRIACLPCIPAIRMSYLYLSMVVGGVLSCFFLVENIIRNSISYFNKREAN